MINKEHVDRVPQNSNILTMANKEKTFILYGRPATKVMEVFLLLWQE